MHRRTTRWHDGLSDASSLNATIAQPSPLAWIDHIGEEAVALGVHQDADEAIAALHGATDDERSRCRTWPQVVRQASRRVSRQVKQEECGGTVRHHARVRLLEEAAALLTVGAGSLALLLARLVGLDLERCKAVALCIRQLCCAQYD